MKTHTLALSTFDQKAKTQVRKSLNKDAVAAYTHAAKTAKEAGLPNPLPPLRVYLDPEGTYHPSSGFHRAAALESAGYTEADFIVVNGTKLDAIKDAIEQNKTNGVRMTGEDIQRAMETLFKADEESSTLSNAVLADMLGCSDFSIRKYRPAMKSPAVRKGKDGRVTVAVKGAKKEEAEGELDADGNPMTPIKEAKGKKGKKEEKGKKSKTAASAEEKGAAKEKHDEKLQGFIDKIADTLGKEGFKAEQIRKGLKNGTIKASSKEMAQLAAASAKRMANIYRVMTENTWSVSRAISILDEIVDAKTRLETLAALTAGQPGYAPITNIEFDGYKPILIFMSKWKVTLNDDGGFTVTPKK